MNVIRAQPTHLMQFHTNVTLRTGATCWLQGCSRSLLGRHSSSWLCPPALSSPPQPSGPCPQTWHCSTAYAPAASLAVPRGAQKPQGPPNPQLWNTLQCGWVDKCFSSAIPKFYGTWVYFWPWIFHNSQWCYFLCSRLQQIRRNSLFSCDHNCGPWSALLDTIRCKKALILQHQSPKPLLMHSSGIK